MRCILSYITAIHAIGQAVQGQGIDQKPDISLNCLPYIRAINVPRLHVCIKSYLATHSLSTFSQTLYYWA